MIQKCGLALLISALVLTPLYAQTSGNLNGQVIDASQAAISGASVTAEDLKTGQRRDILTDNSGRYTIANVPVGNYKIAVSRTGFQNNKKTKTITVGATITADFSLQPGTVNEVVNVTSEAPVIDPNQGQGTTFGTTSIVELSFFGCVFCFFFSSVVAVV